eukprot:gene9076-12240_t
MDSCYSYDDSLVEAVRIQKKWTTEPKYFKKVKISPSAIIKMMMHGQQGVERGINKSGKPIEVMGLLLGRPDHEDKTCIIVSDAQALPIEGFETKVIADDENVINYMIELGENNEIYKKERFCGWYHTHPFDLGTNNCFLSNTDISTQLQWQRSEDPHGNPWLAIVIDPITSISKGLPVIEAFRVYPPDYTPLANETPDGTIVTDDKLRVEKWGACWNRYYKLESEYFISNLSLTTLGILKDKLLWHQPLHESTNSGEVINAVKSHLSGGNSKSYSSSDGGSSSFLTGNVDGDRDGSRLSKLYQASMESSLGCCEHIETNLIKSTLFQTSNSSN